MDGEFSLYMDTQSCFFPFGGQIYVAEACEISPMSLCHQTIYTSADQQNV